MLLDRLFYNPYNNRQYGISLTSSYFCPQAVGCDSSVELVSVDRAFSIGNVSVKKPATEILVLFINRFVFEEYFHFEYILEGGTKRMTVAALKAFYTPSFTYSSQEMNQKAARELPVTTQHV